MSYRKRTRQSAKMAAARAARAALRMARPAPDYLPELPHLRRTVIVIDYDFGVVEHRLDRYRRPYQTRHTFASMMLTAGENPAWIASQLGHSDLSMLSRVYGRWIPTATPDAGAKAVALFCGPVVAQPCESAVILGHNKKREHNKNK